MRYKNECRQKKCRRYRRLDMQFLKQLKRIGLAAGLLLLAFTAPAFGGEILRTDIVGFIDFTRIPTYNYEGYTYIIAEDLDAFCFDVTWSEAERKLYIDYNPEKTTAYLNPNLEFNFSGMGLPELYTLPTDIKTYLNGREIPSFNVDGRTVICFEELSEIGEVRWSGGARCIAFVTPPFAHKFPEAPDHIFVWSFVRRSQTAYMKLNEANQRLVQSINESLTGKTREDALVVARNREDIALVKEMQAYFSRFRGQLDQNPAFAYQNYAEVISDSLYYMASDYLDILVHLDSCGTLADFNGVYVANKIYSPAYMSVSENLDEITRIVYEKLQP